MVGTAEKYVAPALLELAEERLRAEPPRDGRAAARDQRRQRADHDPVDVKQRQDEQAVVVTGHLERVDHHAAHGIQVGVIEHDALRPAGGPAGVDQQRERVVAVLRGLHDRMGRPGGQFVGRDNSCLRRVDLHWRADDYDLGAGVLDLIRRLGGHQRRADRCDRGTQAPCGEHRHHELRPVGQHDRDDVPSADTLLTQYRGGLPHGVEELGVVQVDGIVRHRGCVRRCCGSEIGQYRKVHVGSWLGVYGLTCLPYELRFVRTPSRSEKSFAVVGLRRQTSRRNVPPGRGARSRVEPWASWPPTTKPPSARTPL